MEFKGIQKTFCCTQTYFGSREAIFPLLCPVREADWIDGWEYEIIHSNSGLAELNCVFTTPNQDDSKTIWQITRYDTVNYNIEFVRVTPKESIVKININLDPIQKNVTKAIISYKYTGLNEVQNNFIRNELPRTFKSNMLYWESAINHYLNTGEKLKK